jgi:DNA-binding beta-propeller fold protein YncE
VPEIPNPDFLAQSQVFDRNGQFLRAFASRGRGDGELQNPYGVAVNSKGYVHVCDGWNNRIQVFSGEGVWVKSYGKKGSGEGQFSHPGGIAIGPDDSVVVADSGNSRVQVLYLKRPLETLGRASLCLKSAHRFQKLKTPLLLR